MKIKRISKETAARLLGDHVHPRKVCICTRPKIKKIVCFRLPDLALFFTTDPKFLKIFLDFPVQPYWFPIYSI